MLTAYLRALGQIFDPRIVRMIGWSVMLSVVVFVLLWTGVAWLQAETQVSSWKAVEWLADALSSVATTSAWRCRT